MTNPYGKSRRYLHLSLYFGGWKIRNYHKNAVKNNK